MQAGPLKGADVPHGTAMMLFLEGFFTLILWFQTFRMNVGLNVRSNLVLRSNLARVTCFALIVCLFLLDPPKEIC